MIPWWKTCRKEAWLNFFLITKKTCIQQNQKHFTWGNKSSDKLGSMLMGYIAHLLVNFGWKKPSSYRIFFLKSHQFSILSPGKKGEVHNLNKIKALNQTALSQVFKICHLNFVVSLYASYVLCLLFEQTWVVYTQGWKVYTWLTTTTILMLW